MKQTSIIGQQKLRQVFRPAAFLILLQLTDHAYDCLIHALNLAIGLSMVRPHLQISPWILSLSMAQKILKQVKNKKAIRFMAELSAG